MKNPDEPELFHQAATNLGNELAKALYIDKFVAWLAEKLRPKN